MPMHWMPLRVFVKGSKSDRKKAPFCRDLHRKSKPQLICQYAKGGFKDKFLQLISVWYIFMKK